VHDRGQGPMSAAVTLVLVAAFAAPVYVAAANAESKDGARHAKISADGQEHDSAGKARIMRREVDVGKGNGSHDPGSLSSGEYESRSQTTETNLANAPTLCGAADEGCSHCQKHHICQHFECGFLSEETMRLYTHPPQRTDPISPCRQTELIKYHCATCAEGSGKVCKANMCVADMSENDDAALMSVESMILHRIEFMADELQQTNDHVESMDTHLVDRLNVLELAATETTAAPAQVNGLNMGGGASAESIAKQAAFQQQYNTALAAGQMKGTCTCGPTAAQLAAGATPSLAATTCADRQQTCLQQTTCTTCVCSQAAIPFGCSTTPGQIGTWQVLTEAQWQQTVQGGSQLLGGGGGWNGYQQQQMYGYR